MGYFTALPPEMPLISGSTFSLYLVRYHVFKIYAKQSTYVPWNTPTRRPVVTAYHLFEALGVWPIAPMLAEGDSANRLLMLLLSAPVLLTSSMSFVLKSFGSANLMEPSDSSDQMEMGGESWIGELARVGGCDGLLDTVIGDWTRLGSPEKISSGHVPASKARIASSRDWPAAGRNGEGSRVLKISILSVVVVVVK